MNPTSPHLARRGFLKALGATTVAVSLPGQAAALLRRLAGPLRIGLIADLHQDIMHDGESRLDAFLAEMSRQRPDAILQLGDFAWPSPKNRTLIDRFNKAHPVSLHVIGNHDTDAGHTKKQCVEIWRMPQRFYQHDLGKLRLLILDGNDKGSPGHKGGYPSFIGGEQGEWLEEQLGTHPGPLAVFSHQPLAGPGAVDNAEEIRTILNRHPGKVVICISGHTHIDALYEIGGIPYLHVNSASYHWVGSSHRHESFPKEIHQQHPSISCTCPYRDSLFTTLGFDPAAGTISVTARESAWIGKSPAELGIKPKPDQGNRESVVPKIRARRIGKVSEP